MKLVTTTHPLEQLNRALREADVVLVPIDANDADPFPGSMSDILRTLCTCPMARTLIARASVVTYTPLAEILRQLVALESRLSRFALLPSSYVQLLLLYLEFSMPAA